MKGLEAKFLYGFEGNVLWIEDIGKNSRSVTNDMENVLNKIVNNNLNIFIGDYKVVYRDSTGRWDGVVPKTDHDGKIIDIGFYPIGNQDKEDAIKQVK